MADFQIDTEIDKLVDKFSDDLKVRLKKLVIKSEKMVLKQYQGAVMATKKETGGRNTVSSRSTAPPNPRDRPSSRHDNRPISSARGGGQTKRVPRREADYQDYSDSGSESHSD